MRDDQLILETLLRELEELYRGGVRITRRSLREAGRVELLRAGERFGGLQRLRRLAGIPFRHRQAHRPVSDSQTVIEEIRRRYLRREPLWVTRVPPALLVAAERHFAS